MIQLCSNRSQPIWDFILSIILIIKIFLISSLGLIIVSVAEVFRTHYRSYAFGCIFFVATLCSSISTFSNPNLPVDGKISPFIVTMISSLLVVLVISFFPETLGKNISN